MKNTIKTLAKRWIRPALIPLFRLVVRYSAPLPAFRRVVWNTLGPLVFYASRTFVTHTVFGGRISGNSLDLISRYIYYFGVWEPNLTTWLASRLRPGDVFVDVGANIGYFTLQASRLVGATGKVIAVEASPTIFRQLEANVRRNHASNVELHHCAAAERDGVVKVFLARADNVGETSVLHAIGGHFEAEVDARPLAAIIPNHVMSRVRVIKIDVEGAEAMVLAGLLPALVHTRPDLEIVVEVKPDALQAQGRDAGDLFQALGAYGLKPYRMENDYSARQYLAFEPASVLWRIREPLTRQTDVVFSRVDADCLAAR